MLQSNVPSSPVEMVYDDREKCETLVAHTVPNCSLRPLLKVIEIIVSGPTGAVQTYALLDDGSSGTFIDSEISNKIGVSGPKSTVQVNCIGGLSKSMEVEYVDFTIKGSHDSRWHKITKARAISGLGITPQTLRSSDIEHLSDLRDYLCLSYENVEPKVIIGIDNWQLTIPQQIRKGSLNSQPVACLTALGWVVFGFTSSKTKPINFVNHSVNHASVSDKCNNSNDFADIETLIQDYYKLDSIGITKQPIHSSQDERAISILEKYTRRLPDGQFETGLLWRADNLEIPDSFPLALSRFISLEKKFAKDGTYATKYRENIHAMIDKGYAELCDSNPTVSTVTWYLPHFGVTNVNKPGKLRVVHDAAAKCMGVSLNSLLLTGPDLLQSLFNILLRFREGKIAMTADICEMFPQIKIRPADRDAQRFLWRDSTDLPISTYRMSSMIFGAASSPFTALYLKNKNALESQGVFPDAAHGIIFNTYMDDFIGSVDSTEEAALLARDIVEVHRRAHFVIRGWISNDLAALHLIPPELCLVGNSSTVNLGKYPQSVRTLGLIWDPKNDNLGFNPAGFDHQSQKLTKRVALSSMMRVFDPLGVLTPLIIRARIIFQQVWRSGIDWDQELPQHLNEEWKQWHSDILSSLSLRIPRWYLRECQPLERELHVFCDASENAYAAVAYWRFLFPGGNVQLTFIISKARVCPLTPTTIPRLELQAALVAARLAFTVCEAHKHKPIRRYFWTDSRNVLGWLRNDARTYKPFVSHRLGEIHELTSINEWRWTPTILNVADDATRSQPGVLKLDSRWIEGPKFLLSLDDWPMEPIDSVKTNVDELKPSAKLSLHLIHIVDNPMFIPVSAEPTRFSCWLRLMRASARAHQYCRYLLDRVRSKRVLGNPCSSHHSPARPSRASFVGNSRNQLLPLKAEDLKLAQTHILIKSQMDSFAEELASLRLSEPVPQCGKLRNLDIFLGDDGLIRLSGRIRAAQDLDDAVKFPIVLDGRHPAVRLMIAHRHHRAAHSSNETVVNELRQEFWILNLRSTVRSVAHACQRCRIRKAVPLNPAVGNLPEARLAHHRRPFSSVGLDYFGPVLVTVGRRTEKRYVALFTCMTTRAVHLEVVHSLTTDAAIMSLRRFTARRGTPTEILSDNGTAFVGASKFLKDLYGPAVFDFATNRGIKWTFICPAAPSMGGAWERLVRSVKTALKSTLHERKPREEVLLTLLAEAEALVNSRPLTHVSVDHRDPEALTPFHFLIGTSSSAATSAKMEDRDLYGRSNWKKALRLADHFWNRWIREYLPILVPRRRVGGEESQLAVGDFVVVADGVLPRGTWPRGRVSSVFPDRDGIVRVAEVVTAGGILRRPCKKLVRLPLSAASN